MLSCPGEWWNKNVEDVLEYALARGGGYNISDAVTINGQPGFLYNFSSAGEICSGDKN
jgi:laccase